MNRLLNWTGLAVALIFAVVISVQFVGRGSAGKSLVNKSEYRLENLFSKRPPESGERLEINIEIGSVANNVTITIADESGNVLAGITPYRIGNQGPLGNFAISLEDNVQRKESIKLQIWVVETGKLGRRPPTLEEVLSIKLGFAKVRKP